MDRRHGKRPLSPQAQEEASTKNEEEEILDMQPVHGEDPVAYFSHYTTRADHDTSAMVSALAHVIGSSFTASEPIVPVHSGPNPNLSDLTSTGYVEGTPNQVPLEEQGMWCDFCSMKFPILQYLSFFVNDLHFSSFSLRVVILIRIN